MYPNIVVTFELINGIFRFAPIVADAEAGFGGALNCFELMKVRLQYSNLKNIGYIETFTGLYRSRCSWRSF